MGGLGQQMPTVVQPLAFGFDAEVTALPLRSQEGQGAPGPGRLPQRRRHHRPQRLRRVPAGLRGDHPDADRRRPPHQRPMWDPGPAWNKFFQTEGKATHAAYWRWGNYSVFDADAVLHPLFHTEPGGWIGKHYTRVEGLDKLIDEARSTVDQAAPEADLFADPEAHPRGGARHLPVHPVRHAGHLQARRVRRPRRRVALALRRQAQEVGAPGRP